MVPEPHIILVFERLRRQVSANFPTRMDADTKLRARGTIGKPMCTQSLCKNKSKKRAREQRIPVYHGERGKSADALWPTSRNTTYVYSVRRRNIFPFFLFFLFPRDGLRNAILLSHILSHFDNWLARGETRYIGCSKIVVQSAGWQNMIPPE